MPNPPWTHRTIFQLSVIGNHSGAQVVNVHHFEASGVQEGTLLTDELAVAAGASLASAWGGAYKTAFLACHDVGYTINTIRCQVIERPGNWRHRLSPTETTLTTGNVGTITPEAENTTTSAVIRWRSTLAGKRFRARSYIGPITDASSANGRLATGITTALNAYITQMLQGFGSATVPAVSTALTVYSRPYNEGEYGYPRGQNPNRTFYYPPEYAGNSTNVATGSVDPVLRVQRRREVGVGS